MQRAPGRHRPVLAAETLRLLAVRPGGTYVDATLGDAGHAEAILDASTPGGKLIGIDWDDEAISASRSVLERFGRRATLHRASFADILEDPTSLGTSRVDGLLLDLGVSTRHLESAGRGFSFRHDAPLDMRMDRRGCGTAAHILRKSRKPDMEKLFRDFGDERYAGRIAGAIVRERTRRPIETTGALAEIIRRAVPPAARHGRIHPATRVFQALRIAVNKEIENLTRVLAAWPGIARPGERIVVISFHSIEDRCVKQAFRAWGRGCRCPLDVVEGGACLCERPPVARALTRRPIRPGREEIDLNPRARSARLRAAVRLQGASE